MSTQRTPANRSETFGRLLSGAINSIATYEGKTAPIIEDELGQQIGVAGKTIQRYKAGNLPPDPRTVQILAEVCVRRGMMGREWLEAFLHHARYPFADKLLDQLRPLGPARPRPPRIYENLPAPTYSQFVNRPQAFAEVADGLGKRTAVVLIVGMGGNGKTSLAREVAACCLRDGGEVPHFDAVVWVSDKDRPGTTNLSIVLDETARTLDYPGFTQFDHDEKRREVEQLLKRQRVLLVLDNIETVTDGALPTWLLNLPEPSKALITSREKHRTLWSSWLVELRGMSEAEAQTLIAQRLQALQLSKIAGGDLAHFEPLITVTGGNPKAIEMTLGLVKHERRPLQQVVDDLYAARGNLFDDLFARAWGLLDEAARRVLLVATFFPASASAEALSATADIQGFAFDRAVERLADLALLDVQQEDLSNPPRYALHPLVRAFAGAKLMEQAGFETGARERWVGWYIQLVSKVGFCWDDLDRLELLNLEQETIFSAIHWVFQKHLYVETIQLAQVEYFYYIRGFWDRALQIYSMYIDSARNLKDVEKEATIIARRFLILSRQGKVIDMERDVTYIKELMNYQKISNIASYNCWHAIALYYWASYDQEGARKIWQSLLSHTDVLPPRNYIDALHWSAVCLYDTEKIVEAEKMFRDSLSYAIQYNYQRLIILNQLFLIQIFLGREEFQVAEEILEIAKTKAYKYQDRLYSAFLQRLTARLYTLRGNIPAACTFLAEAIDLFERLGVRRELAEARAELARLEAPAEPAPEDE